MVPGGEGKGGGARKYGLGATHACVLFVSGESMYGGEREDVWRMEHGSWRAGDEGRVQREWSGGRTCRDVEGGSMQGRGGENV